jgi:hypothetical protein
MEIFYLMKLSFSKSLSRDKKKTFRRVLIGEEAESQGLTWQRSVTMWTAALKESRAG